MKRRILETLDNRYGEGEPFDACTPQEVEQHGFLLKEHAAALAETCRKHGYVVSFREAGAATLERIRRGHPCKGHKILDKSVKPISDSRWTYAADSDTLAACRGLVGFKAGDGMSLGGLWVEENGQPVRRLLHDLTSDDLSNAYTGDYDMHDLFGFQQSRPVRILAETPDEHSAVDRLNAAMLRAGDDARREKVAAIGSAARLATSEYSLIRHGAQTSFMCYLHSITGSKELRAWLLDHRTEGLDRIPWQDAVMNISGTICMFDNEGAIFILDTPQKIYRCYKTKEMLQQIPFYYFFKELDDSPLPREYAREINEYLCNFCGIPAK